MLIIRFFIIPISSWLSPGRLDFSKTLSISSRLSILWPYSCSWQSLLILCISALSAVTSSFLNLLIWFFFFSWWVWLKACQLYLLKESSLVLLIFIIVSFISFSFISAQIFMISFLLLILVAFGSSFSSCFRCKVRLSIWCFSCFLRLDHIAINFPLRTAFATSNRFSVVMFSLSFVSWNFFISLLISSVTCWLFRNVLFNLHVLVFLTVVFLVIDIQSHSIVVGEDASYDFSFLKFTEVWSVIQNVVYPGECYTCTWEEGVFFCI